MSFSLRGAALSLLAISLSAGDRPLFIRHARLHPVDAPVIAKGSLLVKGGRIVALGADIAAPADADIVEAEGLDAYPGFMDAGGNLGLLEIPSVKATVDTSDPGEFLPQLQAATAIHLNSELIPIARVNGVTHSVAIPGLDGASLLPGQASAFRLKGRTIEEAGLRRGAALVLRWPVVSTRSMDPLTFQPRNRPYQEAKTEYDKKVLDLKEVFEKAKRNLQNPQADPDPTLQALAPYLKGEAPVLLLAARTRELKEALAFLQKYSLKVVVEAGEDTMECVEALKAAGVQGVLLGSCLRFPNQEDRPYDYFQALGAALRKAGLTIAFGSLGEPSDVRSLPYEGPGNAAAYGLSEEEAIASITLAPARLFGLDKELGSLTPGKEATFFLVKGDPLDYRSDVKAVFIQGERMSLGNHHQTLFERYRLKR